MGNPVRTAIYRLTTAITDKERGEQKNKLNMFAREQGDDSVAAIILRTMVAVKIHEGDYCKLVCSNNRLDIYYGGKEVNGYIRRYGHVAIGFPKTNTHPQRKGKRFGKLKVLFHRKPKSKTSREKAFRICRQAHSC